jgi:Kef-type K+ transport system membrane component KefB
LLGPSAFGYIPGFTNALFPTSSIPYLNLVSNYGLILFLFIVGLELEIHLLKSKARPAIMISIAGILLPFALGSAVSYFIYTALLPAGTVNFGTFLLFLGIAMSITAFPVLARILSELKLYGTTVGE